MATLVVCGAVLTACGGHSSNSTRAGGTPAPVPLLHVVSVSPATLSASSPIVVTFRQPLTTQAPLPTLRPALPGRWVRAGSTATFTPAQAYPPDTRIRLSLARKPGALPRTIASLRAGHGSLRFAQQILSRLHYLPLSTTAVGPSDPASEATAVYRPPTGRFHWRFGNVPTTLRKDWAAGKPNTVLRGAVIAFQHHNHLTMDGAIGPATWKALLAADLAHRMDPNNYSYVSANLYLPQRLSVWVNGRTALTSPVNGGVAGAPTPLGTFPIFQRFTSTTMQGTNPDGSKYKDPGVPWVNYFSGGSAVHGFPRASYGSPQSVGCLELPIPTAAEVYTMINYGTLVTVTGPYVPSSSAAPAAPSTPKPKSAGSAKPSTHGSATASPAATASHHPKHH